MKKRLVDAEAKLRRFQAAIAAGVDPVALVDAINETEEQRAAASAELNGLPAPNLASAAELQAAVDSLADVTAIIKEGEPEKLARLYGELGIELKYDKAKEAVYATTSPRVLSDCVRGGLGPQYVASLRSSCVHARLDSSNLVWRASRRDSIFRRQFLTTEAKIFRNEL
ncbi:hypothetical protein [Lentzea waywayandensis]|uniref:hypothetical protein n=1 Tax=Lentzea waywayandensis TaxID=84724 RepID=UPI001FE37385|nr:hypothetical protein [Lentzea waywayandensis]